MFVGGCTRVVGSGARQLGDLVRRIVSFHHVRAKGRAYRVRRLGVDRLSRRVVRSFDRLTRRGGVLLRASIDPGVV